MSVATTEKNEDTSSDLQFPVVGIGASAGGLEAVKLFLQGVPEKSGMAYVFVQHLSPKHVSSLPEILQNVSKIPVSEITDNVHLEQDHLYIIPVNKIVTATDGVLKLEPLGSKHNKVKIIDLFFSSLAMVHQSFAVGVVLSGTLNDGSEGLQAIKSYGGITFAQDEGSAAFDGMPKNAVNTGAVDFVLPPEKIVEHLITINHPFKTDHSKNGKLDSPPKQDDEVFKQLLTVLRIRRGVDFMYYKPSTLKRRIVRRMALNSIGKPEKYLTFLRENKSEQDALYNDMLISVTNFFRDPQSFELLCSTLFPELLKQKIGTNEPLRIWIAGCASGEEAYSMAICLHEFLADRAEVIRIQIFATDVSETALTKARTGIYKPADMDGISGSRLLQFFTKRDDGYQVKKTIRDMCVFAQHNLLKDPPFSKMDLISCRNVLIYLEPVLQKRALTTFHYSLNEHGFLMLGKSESIGANTDLFSAYNNREKVFLRKSTRGRFMPVTSAVREQAFSDMDKGILPERNSKDIFKVAEDLILSKYTPAGVLVNGQHDIIQFRGATDTWLIPPPGKATLNVLKMVREGLSFELRTLLHTAKKTNKPVGKEGILFNVKGLQQYADIEVIPLKDEESHFLILFENNKLSHSHQLSSDQTKQSNIDPKGVRIEQLEKELAQAREDMRAITEEQEAANEELQSSNEELLSGSEELQSLNEELETSKEELQSANEEVIIVNNELIDHIEQLNNARQYTEAIVNTIRDPLLILDKNLKVKRATKGFLAKFNVSEAETEGNFLYELGNKQWDIPVLRKLLESVLPEKKVSVNLEVSHVFPSIGRKIMLLNARQLDSVDGEQLILLAIEDITDKRKVEEGLAEVEVLFTESKERLKFAVESAGLGTWDYYPIGGELIWDSRCKDLFGLLPNEYLDYSVFLNKLHPDDRTNIDQVIKKTLKGANKGEYEIEFRTIKDRWIKMKGKAYFDKEKVATRFIGTALDITIQKQTEVNTIELLKKKDEFISIASHELKTPLTSLRAGFQLVERFVKTDTVITERLKQMVDKSNINLKKLTNLVDSLLNASKIDGGQLVINKAVFTLSELIEDCCEHIRIEGKYQIITSGNTSLQVCADRDKIDQVIVNMVNNAVKYAPESLKILIHIEQLGTMAKVTVKDSGPGITAEKMPNLFDRYYRVDNEGIQYSGLGLGLYICNEIIKKHDGQLGVESEPGSGSSFWFIIPIE